MTYKSNSDVFMPYGKLIPLPKKGNFYKQCFRKNTVVWLLSWASNPASTKVPGSRPPHDTFFCVLSAFVTGLLLVGILRPNVVMMRANVKITHQVMCDAR